MQKLKEANRDKFQEEIHKINKGEQVNITYDNSSGSCRISDI